MRYKLIIIIWSIVLVTDLFIKNYSAVISNMMVIVLALELNSKENK